MTNFNFLSSTSQINSYHHQQQPLLVGLYNNNNFFGPNNEVRNNDFFQNYTPHIINTNLATTSSTMHNITFNQSNSPQLKRIDRKLKKPFMEKKRRERMNVCFVKLKEILMKSGVQHNSKLEKADILEKTVNYLIELQKMHFKCLHKNSETFNENNNNSIESKKSSVLSCESLISDNKSSDSITQDDSGIASPTLVENVENSSKPAKKLLWRPFL